MKIAHRFSSWFVLIMLAVLTACAPGHSTGEIIDDSVITSKVKSALVADPLAKASDVSVETFKGVVQLSGFVDSPEAAQKSVEIARGVKGVKEVKNSLVVKPRTP